MDTNIGMAQGFAPTPASAMREYMMEHVTALMVMGGIESISVLRYESGFGSRLHVTVAPFADAPREIISQGIIIKDAIAQIMSISNITRITLGLSGDEMSGTLAMWRRSIEAAKAAAQPQEAPVESSQEEKQTDDLPEPPEGGLNLDLANEALVEFEKRFHAKDGKKNRKRRRRQ